MLEPLKVYNTSIVFFLYMQTYSDQIRQNKMIGYNTY